MSDTTITCPTCSQQLEVPEEFLGQVVECPACDQSIQLPITQPTPAAQAPSKKKIIFRNPSKRAARSSGTTSSQHAKTKACPFCGDRILAVAVKCKHCGSHLKGTRKARTGAPPKQRTRSKAKGCGCLALVVLGIIIFSSVSDCAGPSTSSIGASTFERVGWFQRARIDGYTFYVTRPNRSDIRTFCDTMRKKSTRRKILKIHFFDDRQSTPDVTSDYYFPESSDASLVADYFYNPFNQKQGLQFHKQIPATY